MSAAGLTFEGCTTREQARERFRTFLETRGADNLRALETSLLTRDFDVDGIADTLEMAADLNVSALEDALRQFEAVADRVISGSHEG